MHTVVVNLVTLFYLKVLLQLDHLESSDSRNESHRRRKAARIVNSLELGVDKKGLRTRNEICEQTKQRET